MDNDISDLMFSSIGWSDQSHWFDLPKQQRSRKTMLRIFDAAITLFSERGYEATTTVEIAQTAGVTTGSIYRRFQDKKALLNTIIEAYGSTRIPEVNRLCEPENWRNRPTIDIIRFYVNMLFSAYQKDKKIVRIIESRCLVDDDVLLLVHQWSDHNIELITDLLKPGYPKSEHRKLKVSITHLHTIIRNALAHLVLQDHILAPASAGVDAEDLKQSVMEMALDFLHIPHRSEEIKEK